jgi:hypothetical protein
MSSTPGPQLPRWLESLPGYAGYQDKERRRQADRALREELATRLSTSVQGLQRLSAALAGARRFDQLAGVDALTGRLQLLIDRLRTAPEGYRGLFDRERVDEAVLDQIYAFDAALATGVDRVAALVAGLSATGSEPVLAGATGQELASLVDKLHARLDARGRVISGGQALTPEAALAVLADAAPPAPAPLALRPDDAVSYDGVDYLVDAVVSYQGDRAWTEYRLRDGERERWLVIEPEAASLLTAVKVEEVTVEGDDIAIYDSRRYRSGARGQATASVTGPGGSRQGVTVTYRQFTAEPDGVIAVRDWGDERRVLVGTTIDRDLLAVYPRA